MLVYGSLEEAKRAVQNGIIVNHEYYVATPWVWRPRVRCPSCKSLKHKNCGARKCFKCGEPGHEAKDCKGEVKCTTCGSKHKSTECPEYKIQMKQAMESKKTSYAEVLRRGLEQEEKVDCVERVEEQIRVPAQQKEQVNVSLEEIEAIVEKRVVQTTIQTVMMLLPVLSEAFGVEMKMSVEQLDQMVKAVRQPLKEPEQGKPAVYDDNSTDIEDEVEEFPVDEEYEINDAVTESVYTEAQEEVIEPTKKRKRVTNEMEVESKEPVAIDEAEDDMEEDYGEKSTEEDTDDDVATYDSDFEIELGGIPSSDSEENGAVKIQMKKALNITKKMNRYMRVNFQCSCGKLYRPGEEFRKHTRQKGHELRCRTCQKEVENDGIFIVVHTKNCKGPTLKPYNDQ